MYVLLHCVRLRPLSDNEFLPVTAFLHSHNITLQLQGQRDLVLEHILRYEVIVKALEDDFEVLEDDLLVHTPHPLTLALHYCEDIHEKQEFKVFEVHLMPAWYSFLDGIDEFLRKQDDLGIFWLSVA